MSDWLLGDSKYVYGSNPASMHYKYIKPEDKMVPVRVSPCYCPLINQSRGFDEEFVTCEFCKEAEKELKTREGLYETAKGTPISKLKQTEPQLEAGIGGKVMHDIPRVAKAVGRKEHKRLYRIASSMRDTGVYQPEAIYFGCWLVEYKWSWKLNKAVRL